MTTTELARRSDAIIDAGLDLQTLGALLVKSGYFVDTRDQAQAIVKVLAGRELGFGPIASMQGVYIVNRKVTLSANLVGAAIQRSGRYRYRVLKLDTSGCEIAFYERNGSQWEPIGKSSFSEQDASTAGLGGDTYKHFPRNMYFSRALTNGARWYCPDVFNGPIYTPDEMGARVDDEGRVLALPSGGGVLEPATDPEPAQPVMIRSADKGAWRSWLDVAAQATALGLPVPPVNLPISRDELGVYYGRLAKLIEERSADSPAAGAQAADDEVGDDSAGIVTGAAPSSAVSDALTRNNNAFHDAHALGCPRIGRYNAQPDWPLEAIEEATKELAARIVQKRAEGGAPVLAGQESILM